MERRSNNVIYNTREREPSMWSSVESVEQTLSGNHSPPQSPSFLWSHGLETRGSTGRLQINLSGSGDENEWRSSTHPAAREKKNSGTDVKNIAVVENKTYKKIPAS